VIKRLKIADLASDLAEVFTRQLAGEKRLHVLDARCDAALIDDAVELLLELDEDLAVLLRHAVAAHAQLFLIDGLFERRANQAVVVGIIINVADGVLAVRVLFHVGCHPLQ